jgi:hypothetical protein
VGNVGQGRGLDGHGRRPERGEHQGQRANLGRLDAEGGRGKVS